MNVLVCEDDRHIREGLISVLRSEGYETLAASDGETALALYRARRPDFVCLDLMLPDKSGFDLCRAIRSLDESVPIMIITARGDEVDRVLGLELGADDYVVKPFGMREVISRIRSITRRCYRTHRELEELDFGGRRIVCQELKGFVGETTVELSLRDTMILTLLWRECGRVVTRERLFDECWGSRYLPQSRTLDQHISKLRRKLGQEAQASYPIETVHGVGYRYPKASGE